MADSQERTKSKTILLTGTGGYDKLQVVEEPSPHAGPGQVVLNVKIKTAMPRHVQKMVLRR